MVNGCKILVCDFKLCLYESEATTVEMQGGLKFERVCCPLTAGQVKYYKAVQKKYVCMDL